MKVFVFQPTAPLQWLPMEGVGAEDVRHPCFCVRVSFGYFGFLHQICLPVFETVAMLSGVGFTVTEDGEDNGS